MGVVRGVRARDTTHATLRRTGRDEQEPNHGHKKTGETNSCNACHVKADAYTTYTCYAGCHKHTPEGMAKKHKGVANLDQCVRCHRLRSKKGATFTAAADFVGEEYFASCPADGCTFRSDGAGGCPHDMNLLAFRTNTHSDDWLYELLG